MGLKLAYIVDRGGGSSSCGRILCVHSSGWQQSVAVVAEIYMSVSVAAVAHGCWGGGVTVPLVEIHEVP